MLLCALLCKISSSVFVQQSKQFSPGELGPGEYGSWLQDVSFTLSIIFAILMKQLNWTLLSRGAKNSTESRGTTLFIVQSFGSLGSLFMDKVGGILSAKNPAAPYLILLLMYAILTVALVVFGFCMKKLNY